MQHVNLYGKSQWRAGKVVVESVRYHIGPKSWTRARNALRRSGGVLLPFSGSALSSLLLLPFMLLA